MSEELRDDFDAKTRADYARLREEHASRSREKKLVTLEQARANRTPIDWYCAEIGTAETQAEFLEARALLGPSIVDLARRAIPFIDWSPFFHTWELRGRYPAIFDDPTIGTQARELFDDAQKLLDEIAQKKLLTARGVYAFWPAKARGRRCRSLCQRRTREQVGDVLFLAAANAKASRPGKSLPCLGLHRARVGRIT